MQDKISLYDNKYEVILNQRPYEFKCLRYGQEWRELTGDNMVLAMFDEILELQEKVKQLSEFKTYFDDLYGTGLEIASWHLNGDLEPFDNFYESAIESIDEK